MPTQNTSQKKTLRFKKRKPAKVSKNVQRYVKSAVNKSLANQLEHKFHIHSNNFNANIGGGFQKLTQVNNGTSDEGRIGDKLRLGSLRINYGYDRDPASVGNDRVRIIVFQWNDVDGALTPALSEILQTTTDPILSMIKHDALRAGTISVMYDKVHTLDNDDPYGNASIVLMPKRRNLQFDTGSAYGTGHIFMLALGSNLTHPPGVAMYSKLNYTDA